MQPDFGLKSKHSLMRGNPSIPSFRCKPESSPLMLDPGACPGPRSGVRRGDDWCLSPAYVNDYPPESKPAFAGEK